MMMEAVPTAEAPEGEAALAEAVQDEAFKAFYRGFSHFWKNSSLCKKNIYGKLITPVYEKISRSYFYDIYKKETNV